MAPRRKFICLPLDDADLAAFFECALASHNHLLAGCDAVPYLYPALVFVAEFHFCPLGRSPGGNVHIVLAILFEHCALGNEYGTSVGIVPDVHADKGARPEAWIRRLQLDGDLNGACRLVDHGTEGQDASLQAWR